MARPTLFLTTSSGEVGCVEGGEVITLSPSMKRWREAGELFVVPDYQVGCYTGGGNVGFMTEWV